MRLDEWYKHVESFEHSDSKPESPPTERAHTEAQSQFSLDMGPDRTAQPAENRFGEIDASAVQFRPVPAPKQPSTRAPFPPPRAKQSASAAALLPVQKESREQLLARLLDPVLTLEEAAQVLNVCPTTVRRYTNKGLLQHYRTTGNQRRFRLSHVLSFLGEIGGSIEKGTLSETLRTSGGAQRVRVRGNASRGG